MRADAAGRGRARRTRRAHHTGHVETFTLAIAVRTDAPLDDEACAAVAGGLRPTDLDVSVWADPEDPTLLRMSADRAADDLDGALGLGRRLAAGLLDRCGLPARVLEVSAMTDEDVMVWRAELP